MTQDRSSTVSDEKARILKSAFKQYINTKYAHLKDKSVIFSDAFYPYRYDIGMDFWDVLKSEESVKRCRELLEIYFTNVRNVKSPVGNSHVYIRSIKLLKEFIDATYGGSDKFIELSEGEMNDKNVLPPAISVIKPEISRSRHLSSTEIPRPCCEEVKKYLSLWDSLENYAMQESALNKLFFRTYSNNTDIDDILIKVSALNDFYSTNIFSPFMVAKHILNLKIDDRLHAGDVTLVNDIAKVKMANGTIRNFYSFATKYCSHHVPLDFPIYDSYVDRLLHYFRDEDGFFRFSNDDLKSYINFKNILFEFRKYYKLEKYNLKDIDKYLWQLGKQKFPKSY